jgi:Tfp pilus assembly protein PilO
MAIRRKLEKKNEETLLDLTQARLQANNFFEKNQKVIIGVVAGLVIVVGGWFVYKNMIQQPKEEKAMAQMWMAQFQFEQDSFQVAF